MAASITLFRPSSRRCRRPSFRAVVLLVIVIYKCARHFLRVILSKVLDKRIRLQHNFPMVTEGSWESTGATIGRTVADSAPSFDRGVDPGPAAPNVVIVLLDDTGFSQLGCFGSDIDTSNIDVGTRRHHIHQLSCHPVVLAHSGCAPHRTISTCGWDAGRIELEDRLPTPAWPHLSTCSNDSRSAPLRRVRNILCR